jgi:hypothetical protein
VSRLAVKRTYIQLTAFWGNDDAESSIRISRRRWNAIHSGAEYEMNAASWYEGRRYPVVWRFAQGKVWIDGEHGMECIVDLPVADLIASIV